jgi:hypothetical protein
MTVTASDQRVVLDACDATGTWAGSGAQVYTSAPAPVELTGCLGFTIDNEEDEAFETVTADDWSAGGAFSAWVRPFGAMNSFANGGVQLVMGDGTNRAGYYVAGSDKTGFKHSDGPAEWQNVVMDPTNKPASHTLWAGTEASISLAAITQIGVGFFTLVKALGGVENCFADIIRWADIAIGVTFMGGTTSGLAGGMAEAAIEDRDDTDLFGLGAVHEVATGVFGIQANVIIGDSASATDQFWLEVNVTYAWEDRGLSADNYYRFLLVGSAGQTCEIDFTATTFNVPAAASASFDGNGADLDVCNLLNCVLIGFDQGVEVSSLVGSDWSGTTYIGCSQVVLNGADVTGSVNSGSVVAADLGAFLYDLAADPDGALDDMSISMGGNNHHAIDFGTNVDSSLVSITLRGIDFVGFGSTDNADDSTVRFLATTGNLTLNLIDCTVDGVSPVAGGNFSVDDAAGINVSVVVAPVTLLITSTDAATLLPVENVQTSIHLAESPFTELMNEDSTASGIASESYAGATPVDIVWRTRKSDDLDDPRYFAQSGLGEVTTGGFTLGVLLQENTIIP